MNKLDALLQNMNANVETTDESHPGDNHEIPAYEDHASSTSLKERIKQHYDLASDYYYSLW
jgi:tocopherol O-methyltransferase